MTLGRKLVYASPRRGVNHVLSSFSTFRLTDAEHAVGAERSDFLRTALYRPGADSRPPVSFVTSFVDDDVRRMRVDDRLPGGIGRNQDVLEPFGPQSVIVGPAAAVAVHETAPVQRRIEHVARLEGD